jgi:Mor family transcriptional regulator
LIRIRAALSQDLLKYWDGERIYIPQGYIYECQIRDREIYRRFRSKNRLELCHEYGISEQMIYRIVKRVHSQVLDESQGKLFPEEVENGK